MSVVIALVNVPQLKLRAQPTPNANPPICVLPQGAMLVVTGQYQAADLIWFQVHNTQVSGWVASQFVRLIYNQQSISGFLAHEPALRMARLEAAWLFEVSGLSGEPKQMATIWNNYGNYLDTVSQLLGIDPSISAAVLATESGGAGFNPNGQLKIRFENHIFHKYWGNQNPDYYNQYFIFRKDSSWEGHQYRRDVNQPFQNVHTNQETEWDAFELAKSLDENAAYYSISLGLTQVMGFNHKIVGYNSAQEMFSMFQVEPRAHLNAFFDFCRSTKAIEPLLLNDFVGFAKIYNGPSRAIKYGSYIENRTNTIRQLFGR